MKPSDKDYDLLYDAETVIIDSDGSTLLVYKKIDIDTDELLSLVEMRKQTGRKQLDPNLLSKPLSILNEYVKEYFPGRNLLTKAYYSINVSTDYHYDRIPAEDSLTVTVCLRSNSSGGYIVLPKKRIALTQDHGYICMFDGRKILHGVTPINIEKPKGYRVMYVFHS